MAAAAASAEAAGASDTTRHARRRRHGSALHILQKQLGRVIVPFHCKPNPRIIAVQNRHRSYHKPSYHIIAVQKSPTDTTRRTSSFRLRRPRRRGRIGWVCWLTTVLFGFAEGYLSVHTSALTPCAASISAASSEVPTIFEKVTIDTSVPEKQITGVERK